MKNLFFENLNRLIARDFFEWLKFDHTFISLYELQFCMFFKHFVPKAYVFESFRWGIIFMDFVGFPFRTFNFKMTLSTLNTSFHVDLGSFVRDWTRIIQIF